MEPTRRAQAGPESRPHACLRGVRVDPAGPARRPRVQGLRGCSGSASFYRKHAAPCGREATNYKTIHTRTLYSVIRPTDSKENTSRSCRRSAHLLGLPCSSERLNHTLRLTPPLAPPYSASSSTVGLEDDEPTSSEPCATCCNGVSITSLDDVICIMLYVYRYI